jgi:lysophospholipase L1-like esterase
MAPLLLLAALLAPDARLEPAAPFEDEIRAFEAADRASPPPKNPILFTGSSSIRLWKTLAQDFPKYTVLNRGFGGSHIEHARRYVDRIIIPYAPRAIVFYAGGNDIHAGKAPAQVATDFFELVRAIHARLPKTRIAYVSVAPNPARWAEVERVRDVNARIAAFTRSDPRLSFIDVFPHMLGPDGQPRPEIFGPDRLHMNPTGYALWTKIIGPRLEALAKP